MSPTPRRPYRRPSGLHHHHGRRNRFAAENAKPRIDPALRSVFRKIGVPEPGPFHADAFQQEALKWIENYDVVVSAATGSGKTWIAAQAIRSYLPKGLSVWYASPLKALSNSIYQQFCREFGASSCGILTGDRKENPDAPVIVGTTEILRNQLYEAMHKGVDIRADLVILDEAHYLSDPERGVVWEEVLIYLPPTVRLLLLSATISNAHELCDWLKEIREVPNRIVRADERPVPLEMLFLFDDGLIAPLASKKGLSSRVKRFVVSEKGRYKKRSQRPNFGKIIKWLRHLNLLPAIFFLKSRSDCDRAILTCSPVCAPLNIKASMTSAVDAFLLAYPHLRGHRQMKFLFESRVASHHGGQLPYWKVLIEKMMNAGYLEAIFSTSTVAAGVNFPARTVVLVQSDRYNGREFIDLSATEFHQMIGRAGRRGKDNIGFGLVIPGLHQNPQLLIQLLNSSPEPLASQIHINFSMTLNLLLSHTPSEVKELLERSFAAFQEKQSDRMMERRWEQMLGELKRMLPRCKCDGQDPYEVMEFVQKRSELKSEVRRLTRETRHEHLTALYRDYLTPGRLFLHRNRNIYVVFSSFMDQGEFICAAHPVRKPTRAQRHRVRLKKVDARQIKAVFDYCTDIPEGLSSERLARRLGQIRLDDLNPLNIERTRKQRRNGQMDDAKKRLGSLPCEGCEHLKICHQRSKGPLKKLLKEFKSIAIQMEGMGGGLWLSFKRHLRFLKETGFVDADDLLTSDGYWASKLRLDQPLLIAEAIRTGAFDDVSPEVLAGGLAPFVWDRALDVELRGKEIRNLTTLEDRFGDIMAHIETLRWLKTRRGFESPPIRFWPCAALYYWAKKAPWEQLMNIVAIDEGDMASLIMRTADHLRQITNLKESHPELAQLAEHAIERIQREPVYIP